MHIAAEILKDMDEQFMTIALYHMLVRKMKLMYNDHVILALLNFTRCNVLSHNFISKPYISIIFKPLILRDNFI